MKYRIACCLGAVLVGATPVVNASKEGIYVGVGITSTSYHGDSSDSFVRAVDDERVTGGRAEVGYVWDLGKPGGFHLGVVGAYDGLGKVSGSTDNGINTVDVSLDASALSVYFLIEQEIASWVDFVFKVGPSLVDYRVKSCCSAISNKTIIDDKETKGASAVVIGFTFFPTENIGIELAGQAISWFTGDFRDVEDSDTFYDYVDSLVTARTLSASVQYRF